MQVRYAWLDAEILATIIFPDPALVCIALKYAFILLSKLYDGSPYASMKSKLFESTSEWIKEAKILLADHVTFVAVEESLIVALPDKSLLDNNE